MSIEQNSGKPARLSLAERARQDLLLSEPALLLWEVLELEHPGDRAARKALGAALRAAVNFGDLPVSREQRTARIRRKESTWLSGDWTLGNGDPPTRIWTETQSTVVEYVTREAYRTWRAQCPKRLLSDLSKIDKWLGAMPTPVESLPESLPVESAARPVKLRPDQQDRLDCQDLARALWAEHPDWRQTDLLKHPKIAPYAKQWTGKNTVPGWLSEIDPHPKDQRRGRPARR